MKPVSLPELLAPAGDWECARAAVENGADAIYFGIERFNARMRAKNFTLADLPALAAFLHRRGVRGYVTFNTLVFEDELPEAEKYLRGIIAAGLDGAIVQDVGICRLIRGLSADFPIHCSTQMTITSAAGVAFARDLGAQLVVLARENSLRDIEAIRGGPAQLPLEVFVHGALCVAYSGQCLTSESLGGRSANRGECAQACRLPYDLVSDGETVDLGDRRYLLSPQDLAGIDVLPDIVKSGVVSLKIEGRLKSPEYVASITRVYRQALDAIAGNLKSETRMTKSDQPSEFGLRASDLSSKYELEMAFSRGLFTGWFQGTDNRALVHGRFGTKRGVYLGKISAVGRDGSIRIPLEAPLKPGDGVVIDAGRPEAGEQGGRVYQVDAGPGAESALRFGRDDIDLARVQPGNLLWKTSDPALEKELRAGFAGETPRYQRPIAIEVHGAAGAPLILALDDGEGRIVRRESAMPLERAERRPLTDELLQEQFGRLGGTPFKLGELRNHLAGEVILPLSEMNRLRREAVAELEALRAAPRRWRGPEDPASARPATVEPTQPVAGVADPGSALPELIAVIRKPDQLPAAWSAGVRTIYCEFENPKHYRETVAAFRALQASESEISNLKSQMPSAARSAIWVAAPRIFKPGEEWILKQVRSCEADGYLIRNYDHLAFFAADRKRGDFSLNVANSLTAAYFVSRYGLERLTVSYDLNATQVEALLRGCGPARRSLKGEAGFDVTIHQHMPMFHMEHCVFCAFLSTGKDYRDCGRPCDKHDVALRDRVGALLPLKADAGCRNTVYNNRAQSGAEFAGRFAEAGAAGFRVEFVNEPPAEVEQTLAQYGRLLRGEITGATLWRDLKLINQLGVTRGQVGKM